MITPSPRVEALLHALGADAPYRDAILGDLAEEFTLRVEEQGVDAARRWYRRQAMHTAPHLLRQWALRLTSFDVAQIVAFTLIYLALGTLIRVAIQTAVVLSFGVRPDSLQVVGFAWRDLVMAGVPEVTLGYLATGAAFVVVGYALSRLEPRAPLATAVVVGLGLAITTAIAGASNNGLPLWLRITLPVLIGVGTVTGAAVRALRTSTGHRAVAS